MSEPKLISPMLDNFVMGAAYSEHHGIRCYPAMTKDTGQRYIVKVVSIPASQVQLEALLLAGAYSSQDSALAYFKELAAGTAQETQILKKLSRLEGFIAFEDVQIVPMDEGVGYEIYMLSPYKRSLERYMVKKPMTHLNAVNLGLDLCASMVVCRRSGYLYVDLKPQNIYINDNQEFRIGDLGFIRLDSLKYASIPDKYRSAYTAPEIKDAWSSLNATLDTYSIGMILYQIYNDGKLPQGPEDVTTPPMYADYEMAEIILKAIAPDPKDRWQEPLEMGQALVAYMQRNSVNDVPIVPLPVAAEKAAEAVNPPEEEAPAAEDASDVPGDLAEEAADIAPESDPFLEEITELIGEEPKDELAVEDIGDLSFMEALESDDTTPGAQDETTEYEELSDETSDILSLADDLIAHETPEPVVAPEPIDVPIPAPIVLETEESEKEEALPVTVPEETVAEAFEEKPSDESNDEEDFPPIIAPLPKEPLPVREEYDEPPAPAKKKGYGGLIAAIIVLLLLIGGLAGGYYYYQNIYLQTIDRIALNGQENNLTVLLTTDTDNSLLTVFCTDPYGNSRNSQVVDGKAVFTDLNPDTIYTVQVKIEGFHELQGETSGNYTTPAQTHIVQFDAIAGSEDGSVILNFTVDGRDSDNWIITYSAPGETEQSISFSGHMVTVSGLSLDKVYTFKLDSNSGLYIVGNDTVTYTSSALIFAQDVSINSCNENGLNVTWKTPEGVTVESWTVSLHANGQITNHVITSDNSHTFTDIDPTLGYSVEVMAQGMTVGSWDYISANCATITGSSMDTSVPLTLKATWEFTGVAPKAGWLVLYNRVGSDQQEIIQTKENTVTIYPAMPGDVYEFTVQASDGTTVFEGSFIGAAGTPDTFQGYGVTAENMTFYMVRTPSVASWNRYDLEDSDYTNSFRSGEKASFLIRLNTKYDTSPEIITSLFIVRDEEGNVVCTSTSESSWTYMWYQGYCELDIPTMPTEPGKYTMTLYFNGMAATTQSVEFTVS